MDKDGTAVTPFRSSFTTGDDRPPATPTEGFRFTKTKVDDEHGPTAIAVGPDGNVYVSTYNGVFYRLRIDPKTGCRPARKSCSPFRQEDPGTGFRSGGHCQDLIAWITYDDRKAEMLDRGTFSGVVSGLSSPRPVKSGDAKETPYIIGLPSGWHPLNGCTFGPDKRLYISVGSMNRLGDDPIRPETPFSAAVVVADVRDTDFNGGRLPLNVQTTAPVNYDPQATTRR